MTAPKNAAFGPKTVHELLDTLPQRGRLEGIVLRLERRGRVARVQTAVAVAGVGLQGDHRSTRANVRPSKRQVTLIQAEHLGVIAALSGRETTASTLAKLPELLRRNLIVSGINLMALNGRRFRIGAVVFEASGLCYPCSRMEAALGAGGYNAVRGHGGLLARVLGSGRLEVGAEVVALERADRNLDATL